MLDNKIIFAFALIMILVSIQYTLNKILYELRELKKKISNLSYYRRENGNESEKRNTY